MWRSRGPLRSAGADHHQQEDPEKARAKQDRERRPGLSLFEKRRDRNPREGDEIDDGETVRSGNGFFNQCT